MICFLLAVFSDRGETEGKSLHCSGCSSQEYLRALWETKSKAFLDPSPGSFMLFSILFPSNTSADLERSQAWLASLREKARCFPLTAPLLPFARGRQTEASLQWLSVFVGNRFYTEKHSTSFPRTGNVKHCRDFTVTTA